MSSFQIQISIDNYETGKIIESKAIKLQELDEFKDLIKTINKGVGRTTWNWWKGLCESWNGSEFIYDKERIKRKFMEDFGEEIDPNIIIKFYNKFTPAGCDRIDGIKIMKVEEIKL